MDRDGTVRREPPDRRALLELEQHAARARGVHERDAGAVRAGPRRLVHEPNAARLQLGERGRQIVDGQRDVMQPFAAPLDRSRDRRVRRRRLEQLDRRLAHRYEHGADPLGGNVGRLGDLQARARRGRTQCASDSPRTATPM